MMQLKSLVRGIFELQNDTTFLLHYNFPFRRYGFSNIGKDHLYFLACNFQAQRSLKKTLVGFCRLHTVKDQDKDQDKNFPEKKL